MKMFGKYIFVAILFAIVCHLTQSAVTPIPTTNDIPYGDCVTKDQCFGLGADKDKDCLADKNCIALLTTESTDSGAKFRLFWTRDDKSIFSWVAAGLSIDDKMGDDSFTAFIIQPNKTITSSQGITQGISGVKDVEVKGITDVKTSYSNGILTGEWTRTTNTIVDKLDFNIQTTKYYIMLTYGLTDGQGVIRVHLVTYVSPTSVIIENKPGNATTKYIPFETSTSVPSLKASTAAPADLSVTTSSSKVSTPAAPSTAAPTARNVPEF